MDNEQNTQETPDTQPSQEKKQGAGPAVGIIIIVIIILLAGFYFWQQRLNDSGNEEVDSQTQELLDFSDSDNLDVIEGDLSDPVLDTLDEELNDFDAELQDLEASLGQ